MAKSAISSNRETMLVFCKHCEAKVQAEVRGDYSYLFDELPTPLRFAFLECTSCHSPLVAQQDHDGIDDWEKPDVIYPDDNNQLGFAVPSTIRQAFDEATKSFNARAFTACAIMCRKVLESVCGSLLQKKVVNLNTALQEMKAAELIDKSLYEWGTELRIVGNEAAHDPDVMVDKQDAEDMLKFSEAIAEYSFTYRRRFADFKKRKAARQAAAKSSPTP